MSDNIHFSRRRFCRFAAVAAASLTFPQVYADQAPESAKTAAAVRGRIRFSAFADLHYYPSTFYYPENGNLNQIQNRAVKEKCDMIIHMGDFTHNPPQEKKFVDSYNDFAIPSYHTIGNHDQDGCRFEQTLEAYRLDSGYYHFDKNGFRFVVLDANYIYSEGKYIHYTQGNYFKYKGSELSYIPPEELEWFEEAITNTNNPCILTIHQSCEREIGASPSAHSVREIIDRVNRRFPGRVRLFINGHHHRDNLRILNNVVYFDLNSATHEWLPKVHDCYPKALCEKHKLLNHTIAFTDPIHAIITMDYDGTIIIEGMNSTFLLGVTCQQAGVSGIDSCGRPTTPCVLSECIKMTYNPK